MPRFLEVRDDDGSFLVLDTQNHPRVICRCVGFKAPLNAEYVVAALEAYHSRLMDALSQPLVNHATGPQPPRNGSGTKRERE